METQSSKKEQQPWVLRKHNRDKMVDDYFLKFKQTNIWFYSVRDGYSLLLEMFVRAVASVQAQIIIPEKSGIGWSNFCITDSGEVTKKMFKSFKMDQDRHVESGHIDVAIPTGRLNAWKANVKPNKLQPVKE